LFENDSTIYIFYSLILPCSGVLVVEFLWSISFTVQKSQFNYVHIFFECFRVRKIITLKKNHQKELLLMNRINRFNLHLLLSKKYIEGLYFRLGISSNHNTLLSSFSCLLTLLSIRKCIQGHALPALVIPQN